MSTLEQGPEKGNLPEAHGPVLVMPVPRGKPSPWEFWRRRLFLVVFVLFCLELGIILTLAPWSWYWTNNSLLLNFPRLREFLMSGFVRGLISGLGVTDIWLAIAEAVRYRDHVD